MSVVNKLHGYICRYPQLVIMVNYYEMFKLFVIYARSHFPRESLVKAIKPYPCFPVKCFNFVFDRREVTHPLLAHVMSTPLRGIVFSSCVVSVCQQ